MAGAIVKRHYPIVEIFKYYAASNAISMELNLLLDDIVSALTDAKSTRDGKTYANPYAGFASKLRPGKEESFYKQLAMHARYFSNGEMSDVDPMYYALTLNITPSDRMFYECFYFNLLKRLVETREICGGIKSSDINDQVLPKIEELVIKAGISDKTMKGFPSGCNFGHDIREFVVAALTGISDEKEFDITGLSDAAIQWIYEYANSDKALKLHTKDKKTLLLKEGVVYNIT